MSEVCNNIKVVLDVYVVVLTHYIIYRYRYRSPSIPHWGKIWRGDFFIILRKESFKDG